jgi:hypothetical protein
MFPWRGAYLIKHKDNFASYFQIKTKCFSLFSPISPATTVRIIMLLTSLFLMHNAYFIIEKFVCNYAIPVIYFALPVIVGAYGNVSTDEKK